MNEPMSGTVYSLPPLLDQKPDPKEIAGWHFWNSTGADDSSGQAWAWASRAMVTSKFWLGRAACLSRACRKVQTDSKSNGTHKHMSTISS